VSPAQTPSTSAATGAVTRARAQAIALGRVPGGRITDVDTDQQDDRPVWEVEINRGGNDYQVTVDRATGRIVEFNQDEDEDENETDEDE
jgi:uncharacterized membrane protein YkoI